MWVRGFGVFLTAVLLTADPSCAQQAGPAIDWLSPEPLAWANPSTFNWATSPVKLNVHEYGSYNSNILNSPASFSQPGITKGDYLLTTTVGASTKFEAWSQRFFGDASYTVINYLHDVAYDGHNYNFDAGVNWVVTSRCSGNLIAVSSQRQAPQEELFGPGISTVRTESISETGTCGIYQNVSAVLNTSITSKNQSTIGAPTSAGNALDNTTAFVQGGLEYQWSGIDNLQVLAKFSDTRYTNQQVITVADALNAGSLLNARYSNYTVVYNRTFSDLFTMSATGGLSTQSQESIGRAAPPPATTPIYSFIATYLPTPKWNFTVAVSRTVNPPTSVLAGTQVGNSESFSANYLWTPKLSFSLSLARNYLAGAQPLSEQITQALGGFGANTLLSATFKANYQMTPFTSATVSVQKTARTYSGGNVSSEILLFGLDYQPQ